MSFLFGKNRKAAKPVRDKADSTNGPFEPLAHYGLWGLTPRPEDYGENTTASLSSYYIVEPWGQSLPPIPTESLPPISETSSPDSNSDSCRALLTAFSEQRQQHNREFGRAQQQISTGCDSRHAVLENKLTSWSLHANQLRVDIPMEWDTLLSDFHDVFDETADAVLKQRVADWTRDMSARVDRSRTDSMQTISEAKQAWDQTLGSGGTIRVANAQSQRAFASFAPGSRTESFEATRFEAYCRLSQLISAPPPFPIQLVGFHDPPLDDPFVLPLEREGTPSRSLLPRPSIHLLGSNETPEIPLIRGASLKDTQSRCTLQFASDQQSRGNAYIMAQESLDDAWTRQQKLVDDGFESIDNQFEELIQKLEERKLRIWQRMAQTNALSRESIDVVLLQTGTNTVDEAVRAVVCFVNSRLLPLSICHRKRPAPRHEPEFGIHSLFVAPCFRNLPILGPEPTQNDTAGVSWLMEQDYDSQFSSAQLERQEDSESRERRRQLVFDSKLEEWNERFALQLKRQQAEFNGRISQFKRERREYMRRLCEFLSRRIDEASRLADDIVDHKLRECRTVVVEELARLEKARLEALAFAISPNSEVANDTSEEHY